MPKVKIERQKPLTAMDAKYAKEHKEDWFWLLLSDRGDYGDHGDPDFLRVPTCPLWLKGFGFPVSQW